MENQTAYAGVPRGIFEEIRKEVPAGVAGETISRVIGSCFSGRRSAVRTGRFFDLRVEGRHGEFRAIAVDISRSGLLLRILDRSFAAEQEELFLMPYMGRIRFHFEEGIAIHLPVEGGTRTADIVRITGYMEQGNGVILLGCRFREALSDDLCRALEIPVGPDHAPGT